MEEPKLNKGDICPVCNLGKLSENSIACEWFGYYVCDFCNYTYHLNEQRTI